MTRPRLDPTAFCSALLGTLTILLLPACSTQDVTLPESVVSISPASPSQGALFVIVAPAAETAAEEQADVQAHKPDISYHVLIDGHVMMDGQVWDHPDPPIVVGGGDNAYNPGGNTIVEAGYLDAGVHHIELAETESPTVFAVDGMITSGALTRLYVFGPRGGLQARFDSFPLQPPAGQYHVSAINLVRAGGVPIEVVSCTDTATCTPVSPPLSLGDTFDTDTDISNIPYNTVTTFSASGAGYGYRQVATPSLPTPPVISLTPAASAVQQFTGYTGFIAAPIYMSGDGNMILQSY
jgi:hypothetical protein